jgi:CMP-N-acetylneuraminic acid synthetase
MNMVALIPARAGSKRIKGKNTRLLAGQPLLVWTIRAALESGVFAGVACSTDDPHTGQLASEHGARYLARPSSYATDYCPDISWVRLALSSFPAMDAFAILRPTAPFRTAHTIQRAFKRFSHSEVHSLRAVEPAKQHPGKMWFVDNGCLQPVMPHRALEGGTPWHSSPTQSLPTIWIQNASLEMAWTYVVNSFGTISGTKIAAFFPEDYEGFDLNTEDDWQQAERLLAEGKVALPALARV